MVVVENETRKKHKFHIQELQIHNLFKFILHLLFQIMTQ